MLCLIYMHDAQGHVVPGGECIAILGKARVPVL